MTISTVANHVDDNISSPFMTPFNSSLQSRSNSKWIVSITMKDWGIEGLSKI
jgi:hypothetical protein